jgi:PadR family transcriptional regulator, regulatory protein PadR
MAKPPADIGTVDQQVMLAVLQLRPTAYGISIQDHIEQQTGRAYSIGTIYGSLDRLEQAGYAVSKRGEPTAERGGRAKLYFDITAPGQVALRESLRALDVLRRGTRLAGAVT